MYNNEVAQNSFIATEEIVAVTCFCCMAGTSGNQRERKPENVTIFNKAVPL